MKIYRITEDLFESTEEDLWFDIVSKDPEVRQHIPKNIKEKFDVSKWKSNDEILLQQEIGQYNGEPQKINVYKFNDEPWQHRCPFCNALRMDSETGVADEDLQGPCPHLMFQVYDEGSMPVYVSFEMQNLVNVIKNNIEIFKQMTNNIKPIIWDEYYTGETIEEYLETYSDSFQIYEAIAKALSVNPNYIVEEKHMSIPHHTTQEYLVWKK